MVFCSKCSKENPDKYEYCYYCGANLIQSNLNEDKTPYNDNSNETLENSQNTEKSSKRNGYLMLDFSAIAKGLVVSILIALFFVGFIGVFLGSMITGYYVNKKWTYGAINGWIVGFISSIIFSIIQILFIPSSGIMTGFVDFINLSGSVFLALLFTAIFLLIGWFLTGLIGAIGGIIGSKLSNRRKHEEYQIFNS